MKKRICGILAVLMLTVLAGGALAEQKVMLPDSRMSVTLPDELEYDGEKSATLGGNLEE